MCLCLAGSQSHPRRQSARPRKGSDIGLTDKPLFYHRAPRAFVGFPASVEEATFGESGALFGCDSQVSFVGPEAPRGAGTRDGRWFEPGGPVAPLLHDGHGSRPPQGLLLPGPTSPEQRSKGYDRVRRPCLLRTPVLLDGFVLTLSPRYLPRLRLRRTRPAPLEVGG